MVVPFPAGGPTDIVGRIVAERMTGPLGQPVIIENVSGANGTTALVEWLVQLLTVILFVLACGEHT